MKETVSIPPKLSRVRSNSEKIKLQRGWVSKKEGKKSSCFPHQLFLDSSESRESSESEDSESDKKPPLFFYLRGAEVFGDAENVRLAARLAELLKVDQKRIKVGKNQRVIVTLIIFNRFRVSGRLPKFLFRVAQT